MRRSLSVSRSSFESEPPRVDEMSSLELGVSLGRTQGLKLSSSCATFAESGKRASAAVNDGGGELNSPADCLRIRSRNISTIVCRPVCSRSSGRVPSCRRRPRNNRPNRYKVVLLRRADECKTTIDLPAARSFSTNSNTTCDPTTSSPRVGSSNSTTGGSCTRARARLTRCFWPVLSVADRRSRID